MEEAEVKGRYLKVTLEMSETGEYRDKSRTGLPGARDEEKYDCCPGSGDSI